MKLTKYEHACLLLEDERGKLIIDPGKYTKLPSDLTDIKTVIITHEHADHFDMDNMRQILKTNPELEIFSSAHSATELKAEGIDCQVVTDRLETVSHGFKLCFEEVDHAIIYGKSPCPNLSIGIDDFLYYPGDSFAVADRAYKLLALPCSGPWFNMIEAIDLAKQSNVELIFGIHDIFANEVYRNSFYRWVGQHAGEGRELFHLASGESRSFA